VPEKVADDLDFVSVHLYPKKGQVDEALKTLAGFAVGKPVLIEETFPWPALPRSLGRSSRGRGSSPPAGSASMGASRPKSYAGPRRSMMP
jgi:hypothetical protein